MPLFTPEEKKIFDQEVESVKKGMLANKRALVSKYGKDAEKVMYAIATKRAKNQTENMNKDKIKEICIEEPLVVKYFFIYNY